MKSVRTRWATGLLRWSLAMALVLVWAPAVWAQTSVEDIEARYLELARNPVPEAIASLIEATEAALPAAPPETAAELHYFLGRTEELRGRTDDARTHFEQSMALDPSGRRARHVRQRLRQLHRTALDTPEDESAFTAFATIRAQYDTLGSAAATEQAAALLPDIQTPSLKVDILLWLANEARYQQVDPQQAWEWCRQAADVWPLDATQANAALSAMAVLSGEARKIRETTRIVDAWVAAHPDGIDPFALAVLREQLSDEMGNAVARNVGYVVAPLLALAFVLRRAWRSFGLTSLRAWKPWWTGLFVLWTFGGAAAIAFQWSPANGLPILSLAPAVFGVYLVVGAIARTGPLPPRQALALAVLAVLATLSAMYGVLWLWGQTSLLGL